MRHSKKDLILISVGPNPDTVKKQLENAKAFYDVEPLHSSVDNIMKATPDKPRYVVYNHDWSGGLDTMYTQLRHAGAVVNFIGHIKFVPWGDTKAAKVN